MTEGARQLRSRVGEGTGSPAKIGDAANEAELPLVAFEYLLQACARLEQRVHARARRCSQRCWSIKPDDRDAIWSARADSTQASSRSAAARHRSMTLSSSCPTRASSTAAERHCAIHACC